MKQTRVVKANYVSTTGKIAYKGNSIHYESTLERDLIMVFAFRDDVSKIVAQPVAIPFKKNGRAYDYTPDFFIAFDQSSNKKGMLIEVKPYDLWTKNWRDWSDKWKATIQYCKENSFVFHIYDESRIRNIALSNINFLMRFKNSFVEPEDVNAVLTQIETMGGATIDYILTRFYSGERLKNHGLRVIYHLMATKELRFNLYSEINEMTEVWVAYE